MDRFADGSASLMGTQNGREETTVRSISLLTVADECIGSVRGDGWEEVDLVVDSGASETVIGPDMVQSVDAVEGPAYRQGIKYEVANGVRIPNLGEKKFFGVSEEGLKSQMKAQVCDINKGLLSVRGMVDLDQRVVFEKAGGYIEDCRTGKKMWMTEDRGLYMLKMWITPNSLSF